ncbi:uncharacterized protein E5676_scaffold174G00210 [Cucumis melo var. makuwa]|uniref:Uncharacterized protein n=1 Tax=Cucumis melo var. makuwa TaxID=1194695 RepID=A0A5D3BDE3_CUCMM|nr:uncharacterized protein E6C27_scaffold485G00840 [Cucumis melo var. makuwa]TYJ97147.1 uncharacterized protein E5676_scaffold174G00210 [Cucumis melo var. makuwa]
MLKLFSDLSDDFRATTKKIEVEMAKMKMQVNLTMRVVGNQTSNPVCSVSSKLKIPEPKAFNGNRDVKELEISSSICSNTLRLVEPILKKPR